MGGSDRIELGICLNRWKLFTQIAPLIPTDADDVWAYADLLRRDAEVEQQLRSVVTQVAKVVTELEPQNARSPCDARASEQLTPGTHHVL